MQADHVRFGQATAADPNRQIGDRGRIPEPGLIAAPHLIVAADSPQVRRRLMDAAPDTPPSTVPVPPQLRRSRGVGESRGQPADPGPSVRTVNPVLRRSLDRSPTQYNPNINLARSIPDGGANGLTPPIVNGTVLPVPNGTAAAAAAALHGPRIKVEPDSAGDAYTAKVTAAPANTVGAEVQFPTAPPWFDANASAPNVAMVALGNDDSRGLEGSAKVEVLDSIATTFLQVKGVIGDGGFRAQIQAHEDHHAQDHWEVAQEVLGEWDERLTAAQEEATTYTGATPEEARAAVYLAAGGTPDELSERLDQKWIERDSAFHKTPAGARSDVADFNVTEDDSHVLARYKYPY